MLKLSALVAALVSNPISGEVGAAARAKVAVCVELWKEFQTPSAGRWVLQLIALTPTWQ